MGMKGEIARTFGEMIKGLWSGKYSFIKPRGFKEAVGKFAPQFSGFEQQDSQELLTFLLDGLHEDLNRIKEKPYVKLPENDGKPDEVNMLQQL
jgi:ubiquitin C-terminal hydrolase